MAHAGLASYHPTSQSDFSLACPHRRDVPVGPPTDTALLIRRAEHAWPMLTLLRTRCRRTELESAARYLGPIRRQIRTSPLTSPPSPWRVSGMFAVPQLEAIGFDRDSELLLVISRDGRGVID